MHRATIRGLAGGICAMALFLVAFVGNAVAASCPTPPPCDSPLCPLSEQSPYARVVLDGDEFHSPAHYWRLGDAPSDRELIDWTLSVGADVDAGTQVAMDQPGAIPCDPDGSVRLFGAVPDGIWQSHLVGDPADIDASEQGTTPFAMAIWVKPHFLDGNSRRIIGNEQLDGGWFLAARDNRVSFTRYAGTGGDQVDDTVATSSGLPLNKWSFLVVTYTPDHTMSLYVDGALAAQGQSDLQLPADPPIDDVSGYPPTGYLVLGASGRWWDALDPNSQLYLEWDGGLDEAAQYVRGALPTPVDIERLWITGSTGVDPDS